MQLNADFAQRAAMHGASLDWVASPMAGVERRMLDRLGDEVARATTIVRYAPDSKFSAHVHTGGEEYLVLEGVFQDEHGDFPAGTYVRNPPQSSHTPGSKPGCVIFVKLWQFDLGDRTPVRIDFNAAPAHPCADRPGVQTIDLFQDAREEVRIEHWQADTQIVLDAPGGLEVLVLEGSFSEVGENFVYQSWLRLPAGGHLSATTGPEGARVWVKSGHLRERPRAPLVE